MHITQTFTIRSYDGKAAGREMHIPWSTTCQTYQRRSKEAIKENRIRNKREEGKERKDGEL